MPGGDTVDNVGCRRGRGQSGPRAEKPATGKRIEDREGGASARDDSAARLIEDVNGVAEVAFGCQPLELGSAAGRGPLERHELETILVVPAAQLPDCFPAYTAVAVVDDRKRAFGESEFLV